MTPPSKKTMMAPKSSVKRSYCIQCLWRELTKRINKIKGTFQIEGSRTRSMRVCMSSRRKRSRSSKTFRSLSDSPRSNPKKTCFRRMTVLARKIPTTSTSLRLDSWTTLGSTPMSRLSTLRWPGLCGVGDNRLGKITAKVLACSLSRFPQVCTLWTTMRVGCLWNAPTRGRTTIPMKTRPTRREPRNRRAITSTPRKSTKTSSCSSQIWKMGTKCTHSSCLPRTWLISSTPCEIPRQSPASDRSLVDLSGPIAWTSTSRRTSWNIGRWNSNKWKGHRPLGTRTLKGIAPWATRRGWSSSCSRKTVLLWPETSKKGTQRLKTISVRIKYSSWRLTLGKRLRVKGKPTKTSSSSTTIRKMMIKMRPTQAMGVTPRSQMVRSRTTCWVRKGSNR